MNTKTLKEVKNALGSVADSVGKNKSGNFVARRGFFYRHGKTATDFTKDVQAVFPEAKIINSWEHWTAFSGGASTAKSSHWGVEFNF